MIKGSKQYLDWALKNRFKGFLSIVGMILFVAFVIFVSTPKLKKGEIEALSNGEASPVIEEISLVTNLGLPLGEIEVYDDVESDLKLFLNTENGNIRIYNSASNLSWNTTFNSNKDLDKLEPYEVDAMSLLNITYYGQDGSSSKWNIFEYSVIPGNFKANKIENGIQLVFDVRDVKSVNLFEFIPQEISKERYESIFIDGIANADVSESDRANLQNTFNYCYRYNAEKDSYYYRLATTPQLAMINYLIFATELLEYSTEDLISDNASYDIETVFIERPHFEVTLELVIEDGDFVVKVPTGAVKNLSDYFEIVSFDVLPNFGGADYQYTEGYVVLPDGSGAIMNLDSYQDAYPWYKKAVYDNNRYFDIYNQKEYSMDIEMPIFGMTYKRGGSTPMQGYLGIIEVGEEVSYINAQVSDGYTMNESYASFDTIQFNYLKVFGPYAIQTNLFRAATPYQHFTYQVRYKLLDETDSNYYQMSQIYRAYLMDTFDIKQQTTDAKLHLDILGSLSVSDRLFGLPYERMTTFTTTDQVDEILSNWDVPVSSSYLGVYNDGVKNDLMNKVSVETSLIGELSLTALLQKHDNLYIAVNLLHAYGNDHGMRDKYGIHDFYGETVDITQYNPATGQFEDEIVTKDYRVVSPRYLMDLTTRFLTTSNQITDRLMLLDIGSEYYVDYRRSDYISGMQANQVLHDSLTLMDQDNQLIMNNPFMEFLPYTKMITDISRESSNYGAFTESIPFKQLVFNNLIPFTTRNINHETATDIEFYLLQYIELQAIPKFFVSYQNTVSLKETEYNRYYSIEFINHQEQISEAIAYIKQVDTELQSTRIIDHIIISNNVFRTTYDDLTNVYVNYNDYAVTIETNTGQQTIQPYDYIIE